MVLPGSVVSDWRKRSFENFAKQNFKKKVEKAFLNTCDFGGVVAAAAAVSSEPGNAILEADIFKKEEMACISAKKWKWLGKNGGVNLRIRILSNMSILILSRWYIGTGTILILVLNERRNGFNFKSGENENKLLTKHIL